MRKAVGLISGGLDSILAVHLIKEQGFEIIGLFILTPFISGFGEKTMEKLKKLSEEMGFKLCVIEAGEDYIEVIKHPEFGYGKNLNPCIDCHIYMVKKAKEVMEKENAEFVFTGEVLGQRGKSQTLWALQKVEEKSSLKGRLLRPLTALNLPETEVEKEGIVDRKKLLGIKGRERKMQLYLAEVKNIKYFSTPAGGCLLTDPQFCRRLEDLFKNKPNATLNDYYLLQVGRHFRISPETKVIVSRNKNEKEKMLKFFERKDKFLLYSEEIPDSIAIVDGKFSELCAEIFASYISHKPLTLILENIKKERIIVSPKKKFFYHCYLI